MTGFFSGFEIPHGYDEGELFGPPDAEYYADRDAFNQHADQESIDRLEPPDQSQGETTMSANNAIQVAAEHQSPAAIVPAQILRPLATPKELVEAHKEAVAIIEEVLDKDVDYGVIPGTGDKPGLFKPGAERLLTSFACYGRPEVIEQEVDHNHENEIDLKKWENVVPTPKDRAEVDAAVKAGTGRFRKGADDKWIFQRAEVEKGRSLGLYRYVVRCDIVHRSTGHVIASGIGSCSSMESKYIRDPRNHENTVLKMAKKRALIDATLNAFGLSGRFTQDVEDLKANGAIQDDRPAAPAASSTEAPSPNSEKRRFFAALGKLSLDVKSHGQQIRDVASKVLGRKVFKLGTLGTSDLQRLADWTIGIIDGKREIPSEWETIAKLKDAKDQGVPPPAGDEVAQAAEVQEGDRHRDLEAAEEERKDPTEEEVAEAVDWLMEVTGDRLEEFKSLCNKAGYDWTTAAFDAKDDGVEDTEGLFDWIESEVEDAEAQEVPQS